MSKPVDKVQHPDGRVLMCTDCLAKPARFLVDDKAALGDTLFVCGDACFLVLVNNCFENEYDPMVEGVHMRPIYDTEVPVLITDAGEANWMWKFPQEGDHA